MEPEVNKEHKYLPILITVLVMLFVTAGTVGGVWYYMNQLARKTADDNAAQVASLQKQVDDLTKKATTATSTIKAPATTTTTTLNNDQIFQEVATQFGLTRGTLAYFRIFGQDKVQYSPNQAMATGKIAYKTSGTWKKIELGQGLGFCSAYSGVPINFLPPCYDANRETLYVTANGGMVNYPTSVMVSYIGQ